MTKAALRAHYKTRRKNLDPQARAQASLEIANNSLNLPIWEGQSYHLFLPIAQQLEVNTEFLLHILQGKDKRVVVSKSDFKHLTLAHYLLEDHTRLIPNAYGIPEPEGGIPIAASSLDVVFVPLLAFDTHGNRLGYGKGFYDRFLADCKPSVLKVGLSYFEAEQEIPSQQTDVPLDYCITPKRLYTFSRR